MNKAPIIYQVQIIHWGDKDRWLDVDKGRFDATLPKARRMVREFTGTELEDET